jgi:hypothetical protein
MPDPQNTPMVSEVSICNQALGWCGQNRITSLDDDSFRAQLCRENYPFLRDAVMEARMWTFATVREVVESLDRDAFDTRYVHSIPANWLKVFRAFRATSMENLVDDPTYRIEGTKILSCESKLYVWGVQRVTNTGLFSHLFVQCLAARMAADLCMPLTEDRKKQIDFWSLYEAKLEEAAARDGQQGANDYITQDRLVGARHGGRRF